MTTRLGPQTPPMFPAPEPRPLRLPASKPPGRGKGRWTKHRPKNPFKCDLCLAVLAEAGGVGPATNPAKFRRQNDTVDEFLCYGHAQLRREQTGETGGH